jgi:uncharacterized protein (TIGR03067 family)
MTRTALAVAAVILSAAGVLAADKSPIDGKWTIETVTRDGKVDDSYTGASRVHEGGKYTMKGAEGKTLPTTDGTFTVDAEKKTIDMKPAGGRYKDKTLVGTYKLDGDTLTIAFAEPGKDRPKEFVSKEGNGVVVAVMKKAK